MLTSTKTDLGQWEHSRVARTPRAARDRLAGAEPGRRFFLSIRSDNSGRCRGPMGIKTERSYEAGGDGWRRGAGVLRGVDEVERHDGGFVSIPPLSHRPQRLQRPRNSETASPPHRSIATTIWQLQDPSSVLGTVAKHWLAPSPARTGACLA